MPEIPRKLEHEFESFLLGILPTFTKIEDKEVKRLFEQSKDLIHVFLNENCNSCMVGFKGKGNSY